MTIPVPGRPTKLTPELSKLLCEKIRKTLPIEKACDLVGIDEKTFRNWRDRGEQGAVGDDIYVEFLRAIRMAQAEAQEFWLDILASSAVEKSISPNAAFFVLERSDRKNWGRQEEKKIEITQADAKGLKTSLQVKVEIDSEEI